MAMQLVGRTDESGFDVKTRLGAVFNLERSARGNQREVLAGEVGRLRQSLALTDAVDDRSILSSLEDIARFSDPYARWQAAFDSTLGLWLALTCSDVDAALAVVVAAVPRTFE